MATIPCQSGRTRYFAELVNPIPRAIWHGKPLIGIDYAIARGMSYGGGSAEAGVVGTVSTGFIGQGVVNFGRFFGPMAAALLMSLWAAWLARLDLNVQALGKLPFYSLGLILTFNLGRDISLITIYPVVFGSVVVWWLESCNQPQAAKRRHHQRRRTAVASALHSPFSARTFFALCPPRAASGGFPVKRKSFQNTKIIEKYI